MLATAVRKGDLRFPTAIFDDFVRPNSAELGRTPTGYIAWKKLRGSWAISSNRLYVPTHTANPLATVNARYADVEIELEVGSRSGDGIAFRVSDAQNYLRLATYYATSTSTNSVTEQSWIYITSPVNIGGVWHAHDYSSWEVNGPSNYRSLHAHGSYGSHGSPLAIGPFDSRNRITSRSTSVTRSLILEQVENGSVTELGSWSVPALFKIGVDLVGDQLGVFRRDSGGTRTDIATVTSSFNQTAVRHGVSRRAGGVQGTDINSFSLNVQ